MTRGGDRHGMMADDGRERTVYEGQRLANSRPRETNHGRAGMEWDGQS